MSLPLGLSLLPVPASLTANAVKEKPAKRSCSVAGCTNGVVQGGLCVSHGAKRRKCQFPGCTKSSKTAGMCSKHGPKRPSCDEPGCTSISVRGTKCRTHAEPSKKCAVAGCRKGSVLAGVCKRHQSEIDKAMMGSVMPGMTSASSGLCMPVVQVPLSHVLASQQNFMNSMAMAGPNPHGGYPPMFMPSYYGMGAGFGLGGGGAAPSLGHDANASLLAQRRAAGEALTSDALMMLELAQQAKMRSDHGADKSS